jgi:23S rRNA pseudouridine2604 synthase
VVPVGRLDKDSHGIIILTNDGRITDKLLNPVHFHEKEYEVRVDKTITKMFLRIMCHGVQLEDCVTKPCRIIQTDTNMFNITLTEGKKHQIRRMCAALGYVTMELKRIRIMNIHINNLAPGKLRPIEGEELQSFLKELGI